MKKLTTIVVAIVISLSSVSVSFANNAQQAREERQREVNSVAATQSHISPAIFRKAEKIMKVKRLNKVGMWNATPHGFTIGTNNDCHVLITWDGNIFSFTTSSWNGKVDYTFLGTWD